MCNGVGRTTTLLPKDQGRDTCNTILGGETSWFGSHYLDRGLASLPSLLTQMWKVIDREQKNNGHQFFFFT